MDTVPDHWAGANPAPAAPAPYAARQPVLPTAWMTFLKYVLLLGALLNLFNAFSIFSGAAHFTGYTDGYEINYLIDTAYHVFPGLSFFDKLCGILMLGIVVLGVMTSIKIFGLKKDAPAYVTILYSSLLAFNIVRVLGIALIVGTITQADMTSLLISSIISAAFLICNRIYFGKRQYLFVN